MRIDTRSQEETTQLFADLIKALRKDRAALERHLCRRFQFTHGNGTLSLRRRNDGRCHVRSTATPRPRLQRSHSLVYGYVSVSRNACAGSCRNNRSI